MNGYGNPVWEQLFSSQSWGEYPSEEAIRFFFTARRMLGKEELRVLDLGCGKGALAWFMTREKAQVTAMDGAPAGLANVPKLAEKFGVTSHIETVMGDITTPAAFVKPGFDLVIDHYALYANVKSMVANAYHQVLDLLSPGGLFLTCSFGTATDGYGTGTELEPGSYSGEIKGPLSGRGVSSFFTADELRNLLLQIGFEIEYVETITIEKNGVRTEKIICCVRKP